MLTILGKPQDGFCDGVSRRGFLRVGGLAMGGLSLPQLLQAEASAASAPRRHKAVIMVFLPGGPPHQDMWDLKTDAPREIRGEFEPIKTNVTGIEICELFPKLAAMTDKLAFIRSIVGATGQHHAFQCLTGRSNRGQPPGGWPCLGSVAARLQGQVDVAVPAALGLSPKTGHVQWGDNGQAGFLGPAFAPFAPEGEQLKQDMVLEGVSLERLRDRQSLLKSFDSFRRRADASGTMDGIDAYHQQAMGILTSSSLAQALDLSQEDPKLVQRYGTGSRELRADGAWKRLDQFLMARRLVEAGARVVTLAFSRWDWHSDNFKRAHQDFPMLDQGVSALVQDLHDRGLDRDVSVVVWGEFGRTPKINNKRGRDHWPKVSCALLAGGGMRTGQVIGSTDRLGGEPRDRPVHFQEVFATLYRNLGIDTRTVRLRDFTGRPHYLVDQRYQALPELA
ncbi:MAG: DUF1501 domain-containing protein [Phycisphaerae bacterium]|nr:DUF1501 domain-containing protein [Phycisphaerae bacterium]